MELIVIDILPGRDVVEDLINLAQSRQAGITVLSGFGLVSDVTILLPETGATGFPIEGPSNMVFLRGTYINPNIDQTSSSSMSIASSNSYFSISVSRGNQGHIFGGIVQGKIIAAGVVKITAALIKKPDFHKLGNIDGIHHET
ncbi:AT-hook motif nuclear-localized protein 17-like [Vicia villosa]|uniref:AT-hook motif nuclear-localized protein 17-like n=1 Tax=Vicia villosa TaxID=3911 RepID=UPI00273C3D28|nr:AT-hook motif nuclear-localized protein 17-like [Vicia villosa]